MSKTLKQRGNEGKYINLSAYDFIKWLANHRGGHAFEMKACLLYTSDAADDTR